MLFAGLENAARESLIVEHDFFLENSSQLGVFWPRKCPKKCNTPGCILTKEMSEKVQYSRNQAIKNGLNEAILLMSINEALLSRQNFVPFKKPGFNYV